MLRNIAGIMADEELVEISSSGLYNSSLVNSTYNEYSDYLLESLSEFTIMAWVRFDIGGGTNKMTIYGGLYDNLGSPSTGSFSFEGDNGSDRIDFSIKSSASTTLNVFAINTNLAGDTWYHLCVTGSVLDNELKLFLDGQLIKTSTMPYSTGIPWNAITAKSYSQGSVPFYMAQFNVFERRLTEVEVLEHYVYDDDTMSSGALGWDAMTPTQKVDSIYSSSFIQNISSSGNEFNDKTGNLTSVTPKPSLTGDQIYIYTDASDLPSDNGTPDSIPNLELWVEGSTGYTDNSSNNLTVTNIGTSLVSDEFIFNRSGYINCSNNAVIDFNSDDAFTLFCKMNTGNQNGSNEFILAKALNSGSYGGYYTFYDPNDGSFNFILQSNNSVYKHVRSTTTTINSNTAYNLIVTYDGSNSASGMSMTINGVTQTMGILRDDTLGGIITSAPFTIGSRDAGGVPMEGTVAVAGAYSREIDSSEQTDLNNYMDTL